MAESAPIVRPWNAPSSTTKRPPGLRRRASLIAHSIASAPELQKNTLPPSEASASRARQAHRGLGVEEVAHVHEPAGLVAHRLHHARVAVAELGHGDPAQEVEVLVPVRVPQPRALAAHELHRLAHVGAHHRLALELPEHV